MLLKGLILFCVIKASFCFIPEQIRLSLRSDGKTFAVTWTTYESTPTFVEFGDDFLSLTQIEGQEEHFPGANEFIHRVIFPENLPENQRIYYRVGSSLGWSELFWFKTFPAGENWVLKMAIFGDLGNVNGVSLPRLKQDTEENMYDLILHVGDFAYDMFNVRFMIFLNISIIFRFKRP